MSTDRVNIAFGADTAGLQSGVNRAKGMLGGLGNFAKGIGGRLGAALAGGAVLNYTKNVVKEFDRIGDLAKRFDLTAESMQRLKFAAEQSGADVEQLASAMQKAIIAGQKAADGSKETAAAFAALGISVEDFNRASPEGKLAMIADGYAKAGDKGKALQSTLAIMGRSAGELIPLLQSGGESLTETMGAAAVATNEAVANIQKLDDAWMKLKGTIAAATANALNFMMTFGGTFTEKGISTDKLKASFDVADDYLAEKARYDRMIAWKNRTGDPDAIPPEDVIKRYIEGGAKIAELSAKTSPIVASSLAKIGGGGGVFGGEKDPQIKTLKNMLKELQQAYPLLEEIAKNTDKETLLK